MIFMTFHATVPCEWRLVWYSGVPRPFPFVLFEVKGCHLPIETIPLSYDTAIEPLDEGLVLLFFLPSLRSSCSAG